MNGANERFRDLLTLSIYLVLVAIFFNLEGGPPNWIWAPFWVSLVLVLAAVGLVVKRTQSGSQASDAAET